MNQLSPASERRARFAALVFQERNKQEAKWGAEHDRTHTRLEWAGLLTSYASDVWRSKTPRHALVQLAALCLAVLEALDADPDQLTWLEESQLRGEAAGTPEMFATFKAKLKKMGGKDHG